MRLRTPPPSPCKPHYSETTPNRPFLRGFLPLDSSIFVSARVRPFGWRFLALCLCIQKFRSRRPVLGAKPEPHMRPRFQLLGCCLIRRLRECRSYSGLSPSASNCRLHSAGGSRSRSMPMPRGRRPSTAALISLGARKASEMVMLTWRTLHFSRSQSAAMVVTRPEITSSSH
jgi:hypothetical protein